MKIKRLNENDFSQTEPRVCGFHINLLILSQQTDLITRHKTSRPTIFFLLGLKISLWNVNRNSIRAVKGINALYF